MFKERKLKIVRLFGVLFEDAKCIHQFFKDNFLPRSQFLVLLYFELLKKFTAILLNC